MRQRRDDSDSPQSRDNVSSSSNANTNRRHEPSDVSWLSNFRLASIASSFNRPLVEDEDEVVSSPDVDAGRERNGHSSPHTFKAPLTQAVHPRDSSTITDDLAEHFQAPQITQKHVLAKRLLLKTRKSMKNHGEDAVQNPGHVNTVGPVGRRAAKLIALSAHNKRVTTILEPFMMTSLV